jgi:hypothetical protein
MHLNWILRVELRRLCKLDSFRLIVRKYVISLSKSIRRFRDLLKKLLLKEPNWIAKLFWINSMLFKVK